MFDKSKCFQKTILFLVNIEVTTVHYGIEITWKLVEEGKTTITCSGGHYASYTTTTVNGCKLKTGTNYVLFCEDEWGDGWNGGYIKIAGAKFCNEFTNNFPNTCTNAYQCNTIMCRSFINIKGKIKKIEKN